MKTQTAKEKGMNLASDSSSHAKFCRELSGFISKHKERHSRNTLKELKDLENIVNAKRDSVMDEALQEYVSTFVKDPSQSRGRDTKAQHLLELFWDNKEYIAATMERKALHSENLGEYHQRLENKMNYIDKELNTSRHTSSLLQLNGHVSSKCSRRWRQNESN